MPFTIMKTFTFLLFTLLTFISSSAIAQDILKGSYEWTQRVFMIEPKDGNGSDGSILNINSIIKMLNDNSPADTDKKLEFKKEKVIISLVGQKFVVIDKINDKWALIMILDYSYKKDKKNKSETTADDKGPLYFKYNFSGNETVFNDLTTEMEKSTKANDKYQKYFLVNISDIEKYAIRTGRYAGSLAIGVLNLPFKFRPQRRSDFSGGFNLGVAVGYKMPHNVNRKTSVSILGGFSLSTQNIDTTTIKRNLSLVQGVNNLSSLSYSLGGIIEYENAQVGLFFGLDLLNRINQSNFGWVYQGKPWISFGIGYSIFSKEKVKPETKNN